MSVLDAIVERKRAEVAARRAAEPEEAMAARALLAGPVREFERALRGDASSPAGLRVIAELKRASPSRGSIRPDADAAAIARGYRDAGAAAMSVLTDGPSFGGCLEDLVRAREASGLPVLRKDFTVDAYQVYEARAAGADAVLLIARLLTDAQLKLLEALAHELGMAALVEVHDRDEMLRAARLGSRLIGINNRDLDTLEVSLETTRRLLPLRPPGALVVSESGFSRREEMEEMLSWGVGAFLVGESLMRSPDPGAALAAIVGGPTHPGGAAVKVKVCGITRYEDARLALDCGAWALGFIFHRSSPRYVTPEAAGDIVRRLPADTLAVGVFVDLPLGEVNATVEAAGLRGAQLHGSETPEYASAVRADLIIKAFRVRPGFDPAELDEHRGRWVLLDAYREGAAGGTGATFDWAVAREAGRRAPVILAGGLRPENVAAAILAARPAAIDLSSGLEARPGQKDPHRMRALFREVEAMRFPCRKDGDVHDKPPPPTGGEREKERRPWSSS